MVDGRTLPGQTVKSVQQAIENVLADDKIKVTCAGRDTSEPRVNPT
jgi:hypothetical protein